MDINASSGRQSFEPSYSGDGSVRYLARSTRDLLPGSLCMLLRTPYGYMASPIIGGVHVYRIVSPPREVPERRIGWFLASGPVRGVQLGPDAIGHTMLEIVDGMLRFVDSATLTPKGVAFIENVTETGSATVHLVDREIVDYES